jgi:hypothetical protein
VKREYGTDELALKSKLLMWICLGEHIGSYLFGLFRDYDIQRNGVANRFGIETAPKESALRYIEIIFDFGLFVVIFMHLREQTSEQFASSPFLNYWLMIDMIIMFLTLPYTYFSKVMMLTGEITKNIFTLYQVQKKKLKERRDQVEKKDSAFKSYFEQTEKATLLAK